MTDIFFRAAAEADSSVIEEHLRASATEAATYRGSVLAGDQGGDEMVFVAGLAGQVLGSVVAVQRSDGTAHVRHLYVVPDAREVGIGDRLLSGLLNQLRSTGCHWLSGAALPGDRQTKNLFERHGLVAQTIVVGRRVSDSSTAEDASQ